jgi:NarL family two-component system response regulator LiaR
MNPRILIIDDHEIVREGIRMLLGRLRPQWEICGEGSSGAEAIAGVQALNPDVVILDLTMPRMSGLEVASYLARERPNTCILIFTMHDAPSLEREVRESGARGYVQKAQAARDLIAAIEQLLSGHTFYGRPEVATNADDNEC